MMRSILVTGATGKQGGALISALMARPCSPFHIYALTRNKDSKSSQLLASKPNISVVQGDLNDSQAIFKQTPDIWGVFSVQLPLPNAKEEEERGKALTTAAVEAGVSHLVYASADRGGLRSNDDPTFVPHFMSKFNIEQDLRKQAAHSKQAMTWTVLRPVAFMENLTMTPAFFSRAFATMWYLNNPERKMQLISTVDVGKIAADAFLQSDGDTFRNKALSIAGDELSPREADAIFQRELGMRMPKTYDFLGRLVKFALKEQLGLMFDWIKTKGFGANVKATKELQPRTMDFATWLRESSGLRKTG